MGSKPSSRRWRPSPDVVVMDLQMPRASGVVATREITAKLPATRVVVLTTYDDDELVFEAIRAGAQAYLLKDAPEAEVLETVRAVHRGEVAPVAGHRAQGDGAVPGLCARTPGPETVESAAQARPAHLRRAAPGIASEIPAPRRLEEPLTDKEAAHPRPDRARQEQQADRRRRVPGRRDREELRQPHHGQAARAQPHRTGGARCRPARLTRRGMTFVTSGVPLTCCTSRSNS